MALILLLVSLYYVDQPYLCVLDHGEFDVQLRFGPIGEILGFFDLGIWNRFGLGFSYGASNLIGAGNPEFYEIPGVQVRVVAIEQDFAIPQVLVGFDNQGYGTYDGTRYTIMSKGLYCQIGKSFEATNIEIVPSFGFNYCFEDENRFDMFFAFIAQFGTGSALSIDYSPNFSDDLDQNKGYLNTSIKFIFYDDLFFEFALRDLINNSPPADSLQFNRMIRIGYKQLF